MIANVWPEANKTEKDWEETEVSTVAVKSRVNRRLCVRWLAFFIKCHQWCRHGRQAGGAIQDAAADGVFLGLSSLL